MEKESSEASLYSKCEKILMQKCSPVKNVGMGNHLCVKVFFKAILLCTVVNTNLDECLHGKVLFSNMSVHSGVK